MKIKENKGKYVDKQKQATPERKGKRKRDQDNKRRGEKYKRYEAKTCKRERKEKDAKEKKVADAEKRKIRSAEQKNNSKRPSKEKLATQIAGVPPSLEIKKQKCYCNERK